METPTIKPFSDVVSCEKCGHGNVDPVEPPSGPHVPELPLYMVRVAFSSFDVRYCGGGKELENPAEKNPVVSFLQMIGQGDPRMFASSLPPRINICAGIGEEHLHLTCTRCRHEFLMKPKSTAVV